MTCFCIQRSSSKEPHYIVFSPCINRTHNYTDHLLQSTICFKRISLYSFQSLTPLFRINSLCQSYTTIDQTHIFSNKHGTCALTPSVQLIFVLLLLCVATITIEVQWASYPDAQHLWASNINHEYYLRCTLRCEISSASRHVVAVQRYADKSVPEVLQEHSFLNNLARWRKADGWVARRAESDRASSRERVAASSGRHLPYGDFPCDWYPEHEHNRDRWCKQQ